MSPLYLSIWHNQQSPHCLVQNPSSGVTNYPGLPGTCPGFSPEIPRPRKLPGLSQTGMVNHPT